MKSLSVLEVVDVLSRKKMRIFTPEEFRRLFRVTQRAAQDSSRTIPKTFSSRFVTAFTPSGPTRPMNLKSRTESTVLPTFP